MHQVVIDLTFLTIVTRKDGEEEEETPKAQKKRSKKAKALEEAQKPVSGLPSVCSLAPFAFPSQSPQVRDLLKSTTADFIQRGHIYQVSDILSSLHACSLSRAGRED